MLLRNPNLPPTRPLPAPSDAEQALAAGRVKMAESRQLRAEAAPVIAALARLIEQHPELAGPVTA